MTTVCPFSFEPVRECNLERCRNANECQYPEEQMEDHQLKMLSNQDLIAEYGLAAMQRDTATMNMLLKEMERRGIKPEGK